MKIAMISSECVPYAKSGGLADVVGALPKALTKIGHESIVIMPKYSSINSEKYGLKLFMQSLGVWMGDTLEWCSVYEACHDGVCVYFIEFNSYFGREGLYHDAHYKDYDDNPKRFGFLARAALQLLIDMNFKADIIHAHDWQAALAAAYLKIWHWDNPVIGQAASVLTIHNIAYQGKCSTNTYNYLGLQWGNFTPHKFEDNGAVNFLKGGIFYADIVNTVSPTYAIETKTTEESCGLAPYLNDKESNYLGIINGVDYDHWNPEVDKLIPAKFSVKNMEGKSLCKKELQEKFHLNIDDSIPVFGVVSRFASQKGLDVLAQTIESIVNNMSCQFVLLGSGDKNLESYFGSLPARYPGKIGSYIGYSEELSHLIEAGSDFFVMPSKYEPCGLNQIYSLKYGTLPIVRATGGLEDTVIQYNESDGSGTGFKFGDLSSKSIYYTVGWAVSTWYDRKNHYLKMQKTAMEKHFSWEDSARIYEKAYHQAIKNSRKNPFQIK